MLSGKITQLSVFNSSGSGNDHTGGRVMVLDVIDQIIASQGPDVLFGSENGASQSSSLKGRSMKMVQNQFFLLFVDLGHFSQNNIAFSLNGTFLQLTIEQDIGKNLDGTTQIVLEDLGKVDRLFTRCVGIPNNNGIVCVCVFWVKGRKGGGGNKEESREGRRKTGRNTKAGRTTGDENDLSEAGRFSSCSLSF